MNEILTKFFHFSASHSRGGKVIGKNYILEISIRATSAEEELEFEGKVQSGLIGCLESRDLGLHVDFLKGLDLTDLNLLKAFWAKAQEAVPFAEILSLSLTRDAKTKTTLSI